MSTVNLKTAFHETGFTYNRTFQLTPRERKETLREKKGMCDGIFPELADGESAKTTSKRGFPKNFCLKGGIFWIFFYVLYSTLLCLPPLRFHCVGGCWGLLRLRHWQSDALPTRLDLIHRLNLIHKIYCWILGELKLIFEVFYRLSEQEKMCNKC